MRLYKSQKSNIYPLSVASYETLQNGQDYKAYITAAYGKDALEEIIKYMRKDDSLKYIRQTKTLNHQHLIDEHDKKNSQSALFVSNCCHYH